MSALEHLNRIDRLIGCPDEAAAIFAVLQELDKARLQDRFRTSAVSAVEPAMPLLGTTVVKCPAGAQLALFYTTECVFSNYHPAPIAAEGKHFPTSEHYFMWMKAKTFNDEKIAEAILAAATQAEAKQLGRQVDNFDELVWTRECVHRMTVACYRKFQQNTALRKTLLNTAGRVLVEAAPNDRIWGIGLAQTKADAKDPRKWRGANKLGRILTVVREHMIASGVYDDEL